MTNSAVVITGISLVFLLSAGHIHGDTKVIKIAPAVQTEAVAQDADDPAIWINPSDASKSLIIGTDKGNDAAKGGIYVFDLDGKTRQKILNLDRPNNVDVEYGLKINGEETDIVVATERNKKRLVIFKIDKKRGTLTDITGGDTSVFKGETGPASEPMGIALYRRPSDGSVYAFVSRKTGPKSGYLGQYRLAPAANGKVNLEMVRVLGNWSGGSEIESIAVDDKASLVVYSDEGFGYRVWKADPEAVGADKEVNVFGKAGWKGDREGVGFYPLGGKTLSVCTDQIIGGSKHYIFESAAKSMDAPIAVLETTADETDGIEVTEKPLGPKFPNGLLVVMNSSGRNFWLFAFPSESL